MPSGSHPRNCCRTRSIFHGGAPTSAASSAFPWPFGAPLTRPSRRTPCASPLLISTGATPTASAQRSSSSASERRPSTARSATENPLASARPR